MSEANIIKIPIIKIAGHATFSENGLKLLGDTLRSESKESPTDCDISQATEYLLKEYLAAKEQSGGANGFVTEIALPSGRVLLLGDIATLSRVAVPEEMISGAV